MMAATPTKLSSEADVGRSKAQHVVILAFCSKIAGITYSASPNTALDPRLGAKTGLNDEVFVNKLTASVPNGKCQVRPVPSLYGLQKATLNPNMVSTFAIVRFPVIDASKFVGFVVGSERDGRYVGASFFCDSGPAGS